DGAVEGAPRYVDLVAGEPPDIALPRRDPAAPAFLYFTSGSTGMPKGAVHTLETMGWLTASMAQSLQLTPDDVVLPGSSFAHIVGTTTIIAALCAGARTAVPRDFDGEALLALCRKTHPTVMNILPLPLLALIEDPDAVRDDFAPLRLCLSGSDKLTESFEREFVDRVGFEIHEGYGMTEAGLTHFNPAAGPNKPGSIGSTTAGYVTSIRDESGAEVPAGTSGRLWIKGPAITVGYWDDPAATAEAIVDGWLDTGDVVRADKDGYLWFQGRKKQIIIHDGSNISPQEVEQALESHPAVASAGVVGVHDAAHGENVWAYVALKDGIDKPARRDLIRHARARVGYKAPEAVFVLDEMPRNATGKVDRETLKKWAAARIGADSSQ
ncbi:MAG: AMP-binding protein, partial [Pseudomonadota bacterium]